MQAAKEASVRTGLPVTIQGAAFDLFRGIILSDVKVCPENRPCLATLDRVVLNLSIIRAIKKQFPVKEVRLSGGKIVLAAVSQADWTRLESAVLGTEKPGGERPVEKKPAAEGVPENKIVIPKVVVEDIKVHLPDETQDALTLAADWETGPDGDLVHASLGRRRASLRATVRVKPDRTTRVDLTIRSFPIELIRALPLPEERMRGFYWPAHGRLSGKGSIDFGTAGTSLHFKGSYSELDAQFPRQGRSAFAIRDGEGSFELGAGFKSRDSGALVSMLRVEGDGLDFESYWQAGMSGPGRLDLKGRLELGGDGHVEVLSGLVSRGLFTFQAALQVPVGNGSIVPDGTLKFENAAMRLPKRLGAPRTLPDAVREPVTIDTGELTWKPAVAFTMKGKALGAGLEVHGKGDMPLSRTRGARSDEYTFGNDLKIEATIDGLSFRDTAANAAILWERAQLLGYGALAEKAEDLGPTWRYNFMDQETYQLLVKPTEIDALIKVRNMKETGPWSNELNVEFRKHNGYFRLLVPEQKTETASLAFEYQVDLEPKLPRHEIKFRMDAKNADLALPELTGSDRKAGRIDLTYNFAGDGWLAGDLANRSYSQMQLEAEGLDLARLKPAEIIRIATGAGADDLVFDYFRLVRNSDGPVIKFPWIEGRSQRFSFQGLGTHIPSQGGTVSLGYNRGDGPDKKTGKVYLKILADGRWIPDSSQ